MPRRRAALIAGAAVCAVLLGGVAQTYMWRWAPEGVGKVTHSQFAWALLCFVVALAWSRGSILPGIVAGGLTGLGLIVSYYCVQWIGDGRHSAASQFADSHGLAWTVAAAGGGALVGGLGALAGSPTAFQPTRKAVGLSTAALLIGLGPVAWSMLNGDGRTTDGSGVTVAFYGAVGLALGALALWKCGIAPFLRGLALGALTSAVALAGLLALQATVLYATF